LDTILASAGYGLVPRHQTHTLLASGRLVEIAPESDIDLPLYWHHWKLELPLAYEVTRAVTEHARRALQQA
jgi:LysR family transcriptional regulator (chromosome initiation inhibitor)